MGAKIVCHLREKNLCTKDEGERMLAFTNNSGPLFIVGTVGISLFASQQVGIILLVTHILACITVGIIFSFLQNESNTKFNRYSINTKNDSNKSLGEILGESIKGAIATILMIGGFVVIFSIIISILNNSHILDVVSNLISPIITNLGISSEYIKPLVAGIIELTNGLKLVSSNVMINYNLSIIISAFLLGFGGISVLLQVASIVSKTDLSMKKYILGKLLQGIISAIYTFIILNFLTENKIQNINTNLVIYISLIIVVFILVYKLFKRLLQKKFLTKKM